MSKLGRVFGLSIAETVEWSTAFVNLENELLEDGYESGPLCDIPQGRLPFNPDERIDIWDELEHGLENLYKEDDKSHIFHETIRVGISSIGVIDRESKQLTSIGRKPWRSKNDKPPLVDFVSLFTNANSRKYSFPRITNADQIIAQNDSSARCRTEYIYGFDEVSRPKSLLHLIAGEGVNGGIVLSGDFPAKSGHPEIAHCTPQLHKYDLHFSPEFSGCPKHAYCFEALASNPRYRQQFGYNLGQLSIDHPAWDIEAFYLAQLAMIGKLMLDPSRIIFGGVMFYGPKGLALIEKIQRHFIRLNAGYPIPLKTLAEPGHLISRAAFASSHIGAMSALTMACLTRERPISDVAQEKDNVTYLANYPKMFRKDNRTKSDA